jgi:hypothetical protein
MVRLRSRTAFSARLRRLVAMALAPAACGGSLALTSTSDGGGGDATQGGMTPSTMAGEDDATQDTVYDDSAPPDAPDESTPADAADGAVVHVSVGSGCGATGQACCPGESCEGGGCCVDEQCVAAGQPCGQGLTGMCTAGSCGSCGGRGQPCCAVSQSEGCSGPQGSCGGCTQSGTMCSTSGPDGVYTLLDATPGTCVACGADGLTCCYGYWCVGASSYCDSYLDDAGTAKYVCSSKCGGPDQPCCQGSTCKNGGCCMQGAGGGCVVSPTCGCTAGQCTTCGVAGQACCAGQTCQAGQGACRGLDAGTCLAGP